MSKTDDARKQARENLYDLLSEEAMISHACANPKLLADHHTVIETLTAERKELAKAIYDIASAAQPLTEETLRLRGFSEEIRNLFVKLSCAIQPSAPEAVIARLRDVAARREVAAAAADAYGEAIAGAKAAVETIEAIEIASSRARHLLQGHKTSGGVSHIGDLASLIDEIAWRAKNPGAIRGMPFGMMRIERLIDGLLPSRLYLIGARPSVGKTSFAGDITIDLATNDIGVMFFSCEMSKEQLQARLLSQRTGINIKKSLDGAYTKRDLELMRNGLKEMKDWKLWIDDTDRIDIELLCSRARRAVAKDGVRCIIVDYIQLLRGVEPKSRTSKKEEVGEVSGKLKALSKELGVPVIALAQLKRSGNAYNSSSASTEIPKPTLESLKESGDLEQDADVVILLHRDMAKNASEALAIIAKNRDNSTGEVALLFANDTTSFTENPIR
jgi:replicative DNA helicase